jgi:hypothetical protein
MRHLWTWIWTALKETQATVLETLSENPWLDDLRHLSHRDADHLAGVVLPLVALVCGAIIFPCYAVRRLFRTKSTVGPRNKMNFQLLSIVTVVTLAAFVQEEASQSHGLHELIKGGDPKLSILLEKCTILQRGPRPFPGLSNRHLQFLPWMIQNALHDGQIQFERHEFVVTDCLDNERDHYA